MSISLSIGNKKLVSNKDIKFLIFNLPSQITCPNRTELCTKYCYAKKAERLYKNVLPCRNNNLEETKKEKFVFNMVNTIRDELRKPKYNNTKVFFRIHESGDFYSKKYLKDWIDIIKHINNYIEDGYYSNNMSITFVAWTKSFGFLKGIKLPSNFRILASLWNDTKAKDVNLVNKLNMTKFLCIGKGVDSGNEFVCKGDCNSCLECYEGNTKNILVELH